MTATLTNPTTGRLGIPDTIYVVSWVYWNGEDVGGGGFNWFWTETDARAAFETERRGWDAARVRLVALTVPAHLRRDRATQADRDAVTDWIDAQIEMVEDSPSKGGAPALAVAVLPPLTFPALQARANLAATA